MVSMPHDWNQEVVEQYFQPPEKRTKEIFERTHHPIDRISVEYFRTHRQHDEFITQVGLLETITQSQLGDDNRLFIIEGEANSGKAQLCTWLTNHLGKEQDQARSGAHIAIHLTREASGMQAAIDRLTSHVDVELQTTSIEELDVGKLSNALVAYLQAFGPSLFSELSDSDIDALTRNRSEGDDLRDVIRANVDEYQTANGPEESRSLELITQEEFQRLNRDVLDEPLPDQAYHVLHDGLQKQLLRSIGISDVEEQLREISVAYMESGMRPVLICDDLAAFGIGRGSLLDFAIQPSKGKYDIVVGVSSWWETDAESPPLGKDGLSYVRNKSNGYLRLSDENGHPYFLTDGVAVELVRRYVNGIRQDSQSGLERGIPEAAFDHLYPFSAPFVRRCYAQVKQEDAQPLRRLLQSVRDCLLAAEPPFVSIENSSFVEPDTQSEFSEYPQSAARLLRWYGHETPEGISIPRVLFDVFSLDIPSTMIEDRKIHVC
jgi:hypothetical protein